MKFIVPKKWSEFQHYKDRAPPWIKLHKALLNDMEFNQLDGFAVKVLMLFWLLASESDGGRVEYSPLKIAFRMRLSTVEVSTALETLLETGFIMFDGEVGAAEDHLASAEKMRAVHGFGSRHISDQVKREVWIRDGGGCVHCHSSENIEYDHIIPVSRNGVGSTENIQLLCRACNRKKRTSTPAEQVATPAEQPKVDAKTAYYRDRDRDTSTESETESISAKAAAPVAVAPLPVSAKPSRLNGSSSNFEQFYKVYPLRVKRRAAEKAYLSALKRAPPDVILAGAARYRDDPKRLSKPEFTSHPSTWLNADCWLDEQTTGPADEYSTLKARFEKQYTESSDGNEN